MFFPEEDILTQTRSQLIDQIGVSLGGRVAEEIIYDEITTGAQDDLEKSTKLARRMVTEFGMSDRLGPMTFGKRHDHVFLGREFGHERDYGENIATIIDEEVTRLVSDNYTRVKDLLTQHRPHMDAIVKVLLEKETLDKAQVDAIIEEVNRTTGNVISTGSNDDNNAAPPFQYALDGGKVVVDAEKEKIPAEKKQDPPDASPGGLQPKFA
jgi:cell division protease FtsH